MARTPQSFRLGIEAVYQQPDYKEEEKIYKAPIEISWICLTKEE
jgi:hypothetical protein